MVVPIAYMEEMAGEIASGFIHAVCGVRMGFGRISGSRAEE